MHPISALAVKETAAILYAGTTDGSIFQSIDAGISWTQVNRGMTMPPTSSLACDPQNPVIIYAGTSGGIYKQVSLRNRRSNRSPRRRDGIERSRSKQSGSLYRTRRSKNWV
jgi:hypothetical protein